ncbi:hypothetical protein CHLRE_05g244750v5 [Chlamydomonas reinhardtii]|uniref:Uncharacterized protein n=1 Tax=Chlamydomonas reinhardtii TaxID=3055 RepID=A0A2K3DSB7_CHLRE|nr:uncharacterized protein CHLRE_05g244750v5 [Chlamydomonas reinhardtii]PNW83398.1 hypothetical protein CHLRE_05g244750v5 [Chlamydomonas reinhardtii]
MTRPPPYTVHLDADVAQQLAEQGGALLVLGLPEGSYFGIDHMAFHVGPRFQGVKMLPPGVHFAAYSVPGSARHGGGMGPLTGFFFSVDKGTGIAGGGGRGGGSSSHTHGTVVVRRYDRQQELLVEMPEEEAERYAGGVRRFDFDSGLAPYNLTAWRQWRQLTNYLDVRHVSELQPVGGNICTAAEAAPATGGSAAAAGADGVAAAGAAGSAGEVDVGGLEEEEGPESEAEGRLRLQLAEGHAARAAAAAAVAAAAAASAAVAAAATAAAAPTAGAMDVDSPPAATATATAAAALETLSGAATTVAATATPAAAASAPSTSGRCFYTPLHRLVKTAGLTPAQLTAANMDRSNQLVAAAALHWGGDVRGLVGEMQFAFVAFVFGQSLQGFRQWRALVTLFLNCESAALSPSPSAPAFAAFLAALRSQLSLALTDAAAPTGGAGGASADENALLAGAGHGALVEELLLGGGGRDCFLRHHLATFLAVLREAAPGEVEPALAAEAAELRALLGRLVGWQFDGLELLGEDEDDEYAPVVVELPEGVEL